MRIVALHAIGSGERLSLMRLDQARVLGIMAIDAQCRSRLGQVIIEPDLALLADLVSDVASVAAHIQRRVPNALLRNIESLLVAGQTEVFVGTARRRLEQLVLVCRSVRVVTLEAIAHCGRVNRTLEFSEVLV